MVATISALQRSRLGRAIHSEIGSCTALLGDSAWWPGLVIQRAAGQCPPHWQNMSGPLLALLVQGQAQLADGGNNYSCREFDYLVIDGAHTLRCEARTDSHAWLSLQIDPELLHRLATSVAETQDARVCTFSGAPRDVNTTTDVDVLGAIRRLLWSLRKEPDRHVLAPIYLQELAYRLIRLRSVDGAAVPLSSGFFVPSATPPPPA